MPRKRSIELDLPADVHYTRAKGRVYFYHQTGRGTSKAGPRTPLGKDPTDPEFWKKLKEIAGVKSEADEAAPGSVAALILAFRGLEEKGETIVKPSPEWQTYATATKKDYSFYLDKIKAAWGPLPAAGVEPCHALALRDSLADSPGSANHLISVGKTLFKWGVPRKFATANPFREIEPIAVEDDGHWPWPACARDHVAKHAPQDLARFVYLAVQTGQRESDVVRFGLEAIDGRGLWVRPRKTKKRRGAFWVPLLAAAAQEVETWRSVPLTFALERRKAPVVVKPGKAFILSPAGNPYTPEGLRSRWNRWLETEEGKALIKRWTDFMRMRLERDGEEVAPDAVFKPTLHGLRSTAVVLRRMAGYSIQQISNDIGMSVSMVTRYSRFMDQKEAAETNIVVLEFAREAKLMRGEEAEADRTRKGK